MAEAGDLLIPMRNGKLSKEDIYADLSEIVLRQKRARTRADEITLFESVGFALEDLVTARLAYQRAKEKGMGLKFILDDNFRKKMNASRKFDIWEILQTKLEIMVIFSKRTCNAGHQPSVLPYQFVNVMEAVFGVNMVKTIPQDIEISKVLPILLLPTNRNPFFL